MTEADVSALLTGLLVLTPLFGVVLLWTWVERFFS